MTGISSRRQPARGPGARGAMPSQGSSMETLSFPGYAPLNRESPDRPISPTQSASSLAPTPPRRCCVDGHRDTRRLWQRGDGPSGMSSRHSDGIAILAHTRSVDLGLLSIPMSSSGKYMIAAILFPLTGLNSVISYTNHNGFSELSSVGSGVPESGF